jgi:hypothetical protein
MSCNSLYELRPLLLLLLLLLSMLLLIIRCGCALGGMITLLLSLDAHGVWSWLVVLKIRFGTAALVFCNSKQYLDVWSAAVIVSATGTNGKQQLKRWHLFRKHYLPHVC